MNRRRFFAAAGASVALMAISRSALAQEEGPQVNTGAANAPMESERYKPVRLEAKGPAIMDANARDALEHHLHCQCGCNLDVYTCRTTDFSCEVSPAMHKDVMALVSGGYSAPEIIKAFTAVYGDRVLMAPPASGFDLAAWIAPFGALGAGIALVVLLLRRWHAPAAALATIHPASVDATKDEQARLDALVHRDDR
ncbi:MAG TPA: cytochrome c-type biogenesis protein CcmH [Gemmatimonadaceae bacterium]|nr:cytochrome c-type biogenesis protein CcmH [Gemmatimonadaceae bacterium]